MATLERALEWVGYFDKRGTQPELSITGMGETLLHPDLIPMLEKVREVYMGKTLFATNGILLTEEIAKELARLGVWIYVSMHRPELAKPAIDICRRYNILGGINAGFATQAMDWAGEVDWEVTAPDSECKYQSEGWGSVLVDGTFNSCCWDAHGKNVIGHIDDEIGSIENRPFDLCAKCNLKLPEQLNAVA